MQGVASSPQHSNIKHNRRLAESTVLIAQLRGIQPQSSVRLTHRWEMYLASSFSWNVDGRLGFGGGQRDNKDADGVPRNYLELADSVNKRCEPNQLVSAPSEKRVAFAERRNRSYCPLAQTAQTTSDNFLWKSLYGARTLLCSASNKKRRVNRHTRTF